MNWSDVSKLLLANSVELESFRTVCWEFSYRPKRCFSTPSYNLMYLFNQATYLVFGMLYFVQCAGNSVTDQRVLFNPYNTQRLILLWCIWHMGWCNWYFGCVIHVVFGIKLPTKKVFFQPPSYYFSLSFLLKSDNLFCIWKLVFRTVCRELSYPPKKVWCQLARVANSGFHKSSFHQDRPKAKKHHGLLSKPVKTGRSYSQNKAWLCFTEFSRVHIMWS